MELSIPYELVGPDGTRIVFGNVDAAKADADYVGWLDPDTGVTGLDSPEVRERAQDTPLGDGGLHFDFLHGRRPVTASITIDPNGRTPAQINALEQKVKRATNAMRADATLAWTNSGYPRRRLKLRRQGPPRITGRRPKVANLSMIAADYRLLADAEDVATGQQILSDRIVTNDGDELASPRLEVTGPCTSPIRLWNRTTGLEVWLKAGVALGAGDLLVVDLTGPYPVVTINGADRYGDVDFLPSTWWGIRPGANTIRVTGGAGSTGTFIVRHRDSWI